MISIQKINREEIQIRFNFKQELVDKIRNIEGRRWEPNTKSWIIPNNAKSINALIRFFINEDIDWGSIFNITILNYKGTYREEINIVLKELEKQMSLQGFSPKTKKAYIGHSRRFMEFLDKKPIDINKIDIENYMYYLLNEQRVSHSYANQAINAIKFMFKIVLKKENIVYELARPKKEKKLPNVLSEEEVLKILNALSNTKHKAILYLIYSSGLRVSEVVRLKAKDIDSKRMMIHIHQGKGGKDRYTMLSESALQILRRYYSEERPDEWIFPGANGDSFITERTVQRIFQNACQKAKINRNVSVHCLRHSFATHLLEGGTDIRYIQELLGHSSSKTTEIYTHVTQSSISKIKSPLDKIMNDK